jgi:hypothetical protein
MAGSEATSSLFEAVNESYDAFIDGIRKANERTHRLSTAVIEDAQRAQREAIDLTRKWIDAPFDVQAMANRAVDVATKAQGRTLDATRQFFSELAEAQTEARDVLQRMISANRSAGEAAAGAARSAFSRAEETVQTAGRDIAETARSVGDGASSLTRETSRTGTSIIDQNGGV